MKRFLSIYLTFLKQQIKSLIEYKADFALGMIALGFQQVSAFVVLFAVFTQIKAIGSYGFDEMLLFYGYSQVIRGIDHVYNDNIWTMGWWKIRDGSFSQFLVRPIGIIPHIVMERVQFDGFGEFVIGLLVFLYAKARLALVFSPADMLVFLFFAVTGLVIYFSIKLFTAAVAFWTVSSGELMTVSYEINSFTKYPLDLYKSAFIRNLLLYILPFAVVSFVPMAYFIRDPGYISAAMGLPAMTRAGILCFTAGIAAAFMCISLFVWNRGLRRYGATGT